MMDEYITKQEVRTALLQRAWKPNEWHDIKNLISSIPPTDIHPNKHSKWLRFMGGSDYQCPECNWGTSYDIPRKFCPNCGADFIGGDADG